MPLPSNGGGRLTWGSKRQHGFPFSWHSIDGCVASDPNHPKSGFHQLNDKGLRLGPVISGILHTATFIACRGSLGLEIFSWPCS